MSAARNQADLPPMRAFGGTDRTPFSWRREEAQTMTEYAVVLGLITPIVVLALITLGNAIVPILNQISGLL
jgi:Flp pilus assembly pilin Flp